MKDIARIPRSFVYAWKGLRHAYRADKSFRLEIRIGLPVYILLGFLLYPLSASEFIFFVLSYALILTVELVNTAFEKMLDKVHPEEHELIAKSKDIASAAVLIAFLFAVFVNGVLFYTHFFAHSYFFLGGMFA